MKKIKFREFIKDLEISFRLAKTDFKVRNEGSFFGIVWYLLEPLTLFVIILSLRYQFGAVSKDYPIYLFVGLIMFNLFSKTAQSSITILQGKAVLIKSTKINSRIFVLSNFLQNLFSHFFELIALSIIFFYFGKLKLISLVLYIFVLFFYSLFILGVSFTFATLGVFIIDLDNVWRVLSKLLFFITPVFHELKKGTPLYKINLFNPLAYFLNSAREIFLYGTLQILYDYVFIVLGGITFFLIGVYIFEKNKEKFAENL